tara:strand:- start:160 stop:315 length:156 start_codon:yes stop_codon:yes gene_type:complete
MIYQFIKINVTPFVTLGTPFDSRVGGRGLGIFLWKNAGRIIPFKFFSKKEP